MPFWNRRPAPPAEKTPEQLTAELMAERGDQSCSERGCDAQTGLPCQYVDRRDRDCVTAWCPEHRAVVDLRVYCRRHAGVVSALPAGDSAVTMPFPDLENRAPSLVAWVARQIDSDVWRMMLREMEAAGGGQLIADPVTLVFVGVERSRAWERAWKLATHEGAKRRVSLMVEEGSDHEVVVKVGSRVMERLSPPWIQHRIHGITVTPERDAEERADFNEQVLAAMRAGLEHERLLSLRMSSGSGIAYLPTDAVIDESA